MFCFFVCPHQGNLTAVEKNTKNAVTADSTESPKDKPEMDVFSRKTIDCIRVDGGADEGPGHLEVQFRRTEWYINEGREFTLVTTRNSGASCFNLVELQNGVVGRAHANLFFLPLCVDLQRPNPEEYPKKE